MRIFTTIDNLTVLRWGISYQEAILFEWLYSLPSWAKKATIDNETYFFASYQKACQDLPNLTDKIDTMYRIYKKLEKENLIVIKTIDSKTYISLTEKAKEWNSTWQKQDSEKNPTELGKLSEDARKIIRHIDSNSIDSNNIEKEKKENKEKKEIDTSNTEIKSSMPAGKDFISNEPNENQQIKRTVEIQEKLLPEVDYDLNNPKFNTGEVLCFVEKALATEYPKENIDKIYDHFYEQNKIWNNPKKFADKKLLVNLLNKSIQNCKNIEPLPEFKGFKEKYKIKTPSISSPFWRLFAHVLKCCYENKSDVVLGQLYVQEVFFSYEFSFELKGVDITHHSHKKVNYNEEKSLLQYKKSFESILLWQELDPKVANFVNRFKNDNQKYYNKVLDCIDEIKNNEQIF